MNEKPEVMVTCSVCQEQKPKKKTAGIKVGAGGWKYTCTDCILSHGADHMFAPVRNAVAQATTQEGASE